MVINIDCCRDAVFIKPLFMFFNKRQLLHEYALAQSRIGIAEEVFWRDRQAIATTQALYGDERTFWGKHLLKDITNGYIAT